MNKLFSPQSLNTDTASLMLRLIFGGLFIRYGYMKLAAYDQILPMFGNPVGIGSSLSFNLVIFAELVCGILVTLGILPVNRNTDFDNDDCCVFCRTC